MIAQTPEITVDKSGYGWRLMASSYGQKMPAGELRSVVIRARFPQMFRTVFSELRDRHARHGLRRPILHFSSDEMTGFSFQSSMVTVPASWRIFRSSSGIFTFA